MQSIDFDKTQMYFSGVRIVFSTNIFETIGCPYAKNKKKISIHISQHTQKKNSKWVINLNVKPKTIHLLEEHKRINLWDFCLGEDFYICIPICLNNVVIMTSPHLRQNNNVLWNL